ncbi:Malonyl-CoA decarboxylase (MCD) [Pseudoruegeria aquimaris]|uniref:Malonyl-CoA decarboxylase (MCD) n=1 Tax=Pseudoruegeria aquimaris TaxID=393663 RepID=A0A1Y5SXV8_9RHOB|nr:malonyl-CoA decarboxylase [Pseudoruegeria aquimaris]SLN50401.1 Malonyl-CoA decarboxylase (MCD) [Pseudoruegeria aquimaris]
MSQRSFLGDMLTTLFERRRRGAGTADARSIEEMCRALLDTEGEVAGPSLAQAILDRYTGLDVEGRAAFFAFLNDGLEIDIDALEAAIATYRAEATPQAYRRIGACAEPPRQELLRRLNQPPGATHALVTMRRDLLAAVRKDPALARTDQDFRHLLRSWFNRGFLMMRQISWETPASLLEKIVAYEAVHAIHGWDDLRRRLYPQDRRCFAFFHPSMPTEPLIFVEVALTMTIPGSIQHLLSEERETRAAEDTKVAVFYSISNCQAGLKGVSFGNLLIKQVVSELRKELPGLEHFVTLSPIPGLCRWLESAPEHGDAEELRAGHCPPETLRRIATRYLLEAKDAAGLPLDPVARFHLGNGALIHAVHPEADVSPKGLQQSGGAMVNYEYDLSLIETNHERFVQSGEIAASPAVRAALQPATRKNRIQA